MTCAGGAGPWQPALVRRGYDPRSEAAAWRLQVLPCKLPDKWCAPGRTGHAVAAVPTHTAPARPPLTTRTREKICAVSSFPVVFPGDPDGSG